MENQFEEYRVNMIDMITKQYDLSEELIQSEIDSLYFYSTDKLTQTSSITYEPSLCVILQGSKAVGFGDNMYGYNEKEYLLASTHVPADIKILEASKEVPYLSLTLTFKLEDVYEVLKNTNPDKLKYSKTTEKGLFFNNMDLELYDSISRLIKTLQRPKDEIKYLSSLIIKEILYNLVNGESGYFLNKFAMEGTVSNKIAKAVSEIRDNFNVKLNIKELAELLDISESSLYQNFKTITSMSPIQFQKKLRLEEAKMMLINQNIEASEVAYAVGYESPSQFSREYTRMYGMSPKAHADHIKSQIA